MAIRAEQESTAPFLNGIEKEGRGIGNAAMAPRDRARIQLDEGGHGKTRLQRLTRQGTEARIVIVGHTKLRNEIKGVEISLSAYVKCGLYKEFTTLYSYQGNPVIFAGTNNYGNREVVFAMDIHKSNITVSFDYAAIMRNLSDILG